MSKATEAVKFPGFIEVLVRCSDGYEYWIPEWHVPKGIKWLYE